MSVSFLRIDDRMIHAIVCHGYGLCSDVKPEHVGH